MDIRERALSMIKNAENETVSGSLLQKVRLFCWETGLGPAINAVPAVSGEQAVLYFPGRSGKFSLSCCEFDGRVLMALTEEELQKISGVLLQSPAVEVWMKDGWYAGTARLLTPEEQAVLTAKITDEQFFGKAGNMLGRSLQKDCRLIEVTRSAPCTGRSGPGSKAWVWPLAACLLLFSRKKK